MGGGRKDGLGGVAVFMASSVRIAKDGKSATVTLTKKDGTTEKVRIFGTVSRDQANTIADTLRIRGIHDGDGKVALRAISFDRGVPRGEAVFVVDGKKMGIAPGTRGQNLRRLLHHELTHVRTSGDLIKGKNLAKYGPTARRYLNAVVNSRYSSHAMRRAGFARSTSERFGRQSQEWWQAAQGEAKSILQRARQGKWGRARFVKEVLRFDNSMQDINAVSGLRLPVHSGRLSGLTHSPRGNPGYGLSNFREFLAVNAERFTSQKVPRLTKDIGRL